MLKIKRIEFNPFQVNTYVVYDPVSHEAMIVDPGMLLPEETSLLASFIDSNGLNVTRIVNTHLHLDHIFGNQAAADLFNTVPYANVADFPLGHDLESQARSFGIPTSLIRQPEKFQQLTEGETFHIGSDEIHAISIPGHSPCGLALYCPAGEWVITGDSLFRSSIGRTDLPGGNHQQLVTAVRSKLLSLPPQTIVYPGHGPSTTIAAEQTNPYL